MCGTWYDVNTNYLSYPRYIHLGNTYKSRSSITVGSLQSTSGMGTLYEHHKAKNINIPSFINKKRGNQMEIILLKYSLDSFIFEIIFPRHSVKSYSFNTFQDIMIYHKGKGRTKFLLLFLIFKNSQFNSQILVR